LQTRMRLFCLTELNDSESMWGLYADSNKGIALGFHTNLLERYWKCLLAKVVYDDTFPVMFDVDELMRHIILGHPGNGMIADAATNLCCTKSRQWDKEEEWRTYSVAERGTKALSSLIRVPDNALAEVYFGCDCPQSVRSRVMEYCRKNYSHMLWYYEMVRDKTKRGLVPNRIS